MSDLLDSGKVGHKIHNPDNLNDCDLIDFMSYALLFNNVTTKIDKKNFKNYWERAREIEYKNHVDLNLFLYQHTVDISDTMFDQNFAGKVPLGNFYPNESIAYNNSNDIVEIKVCENHNNNFVLRPFVPNYENVNFCRQDGNKEVMKYYNDDVFDKLITKKSNQYTLKDKNYKNKITNLKKLFNSSFDDAILKEKLKIYNTVSTFVKHNNASLNDDERFDVTALNNIDFNKPYDVKDNDNVFNFIENNYVINLGNQYPENNFCDNISISCDIKENPFNIDEQRKQYGSLDTSQYSYYSFEDRNEIAFKDNENVLSNFRNTIIGRNFSCEKKVMFEKTNISLIDKPIKASNYEFSFFKKCIHKEFI